MTNNIRHTIRFNDGITGGRITFDVTGRNDVCGINWMNDTHRNEGYGENG